MCRHGLWSSSCLRFSLLYSYLCKLSLTKRTHHSLCVIPFLHFILFPYSLKAFHTSSIFFLQSTLFPSLNWHHFCTMWPATTDLIKNSQEVNTRPNLSFDPDDLTSWIFIRMRHGQTMARWSNTDHSIIMASHFVMLVEKKRKAWTWLGQSVKTRRNCLTLLFLKPLSFVWGWISCSAKHSTLGYTTECTSNINNNCMHN